MAGLVDNRYALSLFDVGVELDMLQEFYKELSLMVLLLEKVYTNHFKLE